MAEVPPPVGGLLHLDAQGLSPLEGAQHPQQVPQGGLGRDEQEDHRHGPAQGNEG